MRDVSIDRFFDRARNHGKSIAYYAKLKGNYEPTTWDQYGKNVVHFALGLIALGLKESQSVGILGFNRPEWVTSCIAAQAAGGVSVGVYSSSSAEEVLHILEHSEANFLVVENGKRWREQIEPVLHKLPLLKKIVLMEPDDVIEEGRVMTYLQVLELGKVQSKKLLDERISSICPDQTAVLIYTSGTTGAPKAVMLSHRAINWTVQSAVTLLKVGQGDSLVSYLPLAHVAEQMFTIYAPSYSGLCIYFAESIEALPENLKEVQPTALFGVPRIYEKICDKVSEKLALATGAKAILLKWARSVSTKYWNLNHRNALVPSLLFMQYNLARRLVFNKLKPLLGLGRARLCISGAAPISQEIVRFFLSIDIPIYEVYGQSEDCGPTTFNIPKATKLGTVGRSLPGVELKIAEDGEILVRGPHLFSGYYKDQAATNEVLKAGWLCSGDVGQIDKDGYLRITDRKKDLLITAGGKNVSPQNLEAMLKQIPLVSLAVVIGDQKKYLVALLTPNQENLLDFARKRGIRNQTISDLVQHRLVRQEIQKAIEVLNEKVASVEQIKKFLYLSKDFTVEDGELTPTLKIKRKVINTRYQDSIESMYSAAA
jgi:long-chain acyl-CoA synthetase